MLIAVGDIDINEILDSIILMAKDLTTVHERNEKTGLGSWQHKDGWGLAYLKDSKWAVVKSKKPIFEDPKIDEFRNLKAEAVIIHARWLTKGALCEDDTHPFQIEDKVFCHNGTVAGNITPGNHTPKGKTDSEELFCSLLSFFTEDNPQIILERLSSCDVNTGSNIILSTPSKSFVAVHFKKYPVYYKMVLGKKDGSIIVGSEKLACCKGYEWEYLGNNDLVTITHRTKEVLVQKCRWIA